MTTADHVHHPAAANFVALNPMVFLERAARVHGDKPAIVYHGFTQSWAHTHARCRRLAAAIRAAGVAQGETVSVMLPNVPAMVEAHFGVPMSGAVLNCLNTRLDQAGIAYILAHSDTRLIIADAEYAALVRDALAANGAPARPVQVVICADVEAGFIAADDNYEAFLASGAGGEAAPALLPLRETDTICLNYTSGTTGKPKGVLYHYRGAYLNALGNILTWSMPKHPSYLWTLPMFHCNGWCFPWTIAALAGINVCLRKVDTSAIFDAIEQYAVTHYCGAPIVHNLLANAPQAQQRKLTRSLQGMVAGAAPTRSTIAAMESMGIELTHVYGLTEVYGPSAVCEAQPQWQQLDSAQRAQRVSRQGVPCLVQEDVSVRDPATLQPVPADGLTMGEVMFRGNVVMTGYLKDPDATEAALRGGWFHTGDLGVIEPDGYIRLTDRSKDIIISGGENISSLELEEVISQHPAVSLAAVVARPDPKWGETPVAFVELKAGASLSAEQLLAFCKQRLASFKCPREVFFCTIPKTATGKIQKFALREEFRIPSILPK